MKQSPETAVAIRADCACGDVALTVCGPARSMMLCGCRDCRIVTGTGHSAVALFAHADIGVSGETTSFRRPADSGATVTRRFCPRCGTTIVAQSTRAPGMVLVPAGLLGGEGWFRPTQMIFGAHAADWDTLPADLPRHTRYREQETR